MRVGYSAVVFFTLLAGDARHYTIGWFDWAALVLVLAGFGAALLAQYRSRGALGRLQYPLLALLALAVLSTAWSFYAGLTLNTAAPWVTAVGTGGLHPRALIPV